MYPYKVLHIESSILAKSDDWLLKGNIDGYHTSKDVEALVLEQEKAGYVLFGITPLTGMAVKSPYTVTTTVGLLVTFKRKESQSVA